MELVVLFLFIFVPYLSCAIRMQNNTCLLSCKTIHVDGKAIQPELKVSELLPSQATVRQILCQIPACYFNPCKPGCACHETQDGFRCECQHISVTVPTVSDAGTPDNCTELHTLTGANYSWGLPSFGNNNITDVDFSVKVKAAAVIVLSTKQGPPGNVVYEIVIGGHGDTQTAFRRCDPTCNTFYKKDGEFLSKNSFSRFRVTLDTGQLSMFRHGESVPYMTGRDEKPVVRASFIGYQTRTHDGVWLFHGPCV